MCQKEHPAGGVAVLTWTRSSPCACSAVGRSSGSTGGLPAQTGRGRPCCRGGSGTSAAPGASGCVPGSGQASGRSGSSSSTHTYTPARKHTASSKSGCMSDATLVPICSIPITYAYWNLYKRLKTKLNFFTFNSISILLKWDFFRLQLLRTEK